MRYPADELQAIRDYFKSDEVVCIKRLYKLDNGTSCYTVKLGNGLSAELYIVKRSGALLLWENIF